MPLGEKANAYRRAGILFAEIFSTVTIKQEAKKRIFNRLITCIWQQRSLKISPVDEVSCSQEKPLEFKMS